MLGGVVGGLVTAWVLSQFGFDAGFIQGCHELFNLTISESSYYVVFAMLGAISGLVSNGRSY